jgi:hypothetical protein
MARPSAVALPAGTINADLADRFTGHAVDLDGLEKGTMRKVRANLRALEKDLRRKIESIVAEPDRAAKVRRLAQAEKLLAQTRATLDRRLKKVRRSLDGELRELAALTADRADDIFRDVLGGSVVATTFTRGDLVRLADETMIQGAPQAEWWARQTATLRGNFGSQMRLGIAAGETNRELMKRTRDVLGTAERHLETHVRTSVQTVSNRVLEDVYRENQDVLAGVEAVVTLDTRTTMVCMSRSGARWDLETGEPMKGSPRQEGYPGPPPWHWRCRSILSPVTKSWEQIVDDASGKKLKIAEKKVGAKQRAAMGGPARGNITFDGWLKKQSPETQLKLLGDERRQLWLDGKIKLRDLTDARGQPRTVAQLRSGDGALPKTTKRAAQPAKDAQPANAPQPAGPGELLDGEAILAKMREYHPGGKRYEEVAAEVEKRSGTPKTRKKIAKAKRDLEKARAAGKDDEALTLETFIEMSEVDLRMAQRMDARKIELKITQEAREHFKLPEGAPGLKFERLPGAFDGAPAELRQKATEAMDWLEGIVHRNASRSVKVKFEYAPGRAIARPWESLVYIDSASSTRVYVHELGHLIEGEGKFIGSEWVNRSAKWRDARVAATTKERAPRSLREMTGKSAYREEEVAFEDHFRRQYVGKVYQISGGEDYSTEVLSMGLEWLYADPVKFSIADPEHFKYVIDSVRGLLP